MKKRKIKVKHTEAASSSLAYRTKVDIQIGHQLCKNTRLIIIQHLNLKGGKEREIVKRELH